MTFPRTPPFSDGVDNLGAATFNDIEGRAQTYVDTAIATVTVAGAPADGQLPIYSAAAGQPTWTAPPWFAGTGPGGTLGGNSGSVITIPNPLGIAGFGIYHMTLNAAVVTVTLPSPATLGARFVLRLSEDVTGGRTVVFAASPPFSFPGIPFNLNTQARAENWIAFECGLDSSSTTTWYGFPVTSSKTQNFNNVFGDGSDGAVVLDGAASVSWAALNSNVYTMSRDFYSTSLKVNTGVTLACNNFRPFVAGTLTNAGTIGIKAANAVGATKGSKSAINTINGGQDGANGGVGAGTAGSQGTFGTGGGGGSGTSGAGGTGQVGTLTGGSALSQLQQVTKTPTVVLGNQQFLFGATTPITFMGGSGGSSGAGDGVNSGGAGGAGGDLLVVLAESIINNGTIKAVGGNGGTPAAGNCGEGGGGAGGTVLIYTLTPITQNATVAYVQRVASGSTSGVSSLTVAITANTTQGNRIILEVGGSGGVKINAVSDTKGNTWAVDEVSANTSGARISVASTYLTTALTTSDTLTVTMSAIGQTRWAAHEYSGIQAITPIDAVAQTSGTGTSSTLSITPAASGDYLFSAICVAATQSSFTAPSGFSERVSGQTTSVSIDAADDLPGAGGSPIATGWSWPLSNTYAEVTVAYLTSTGTINVAGGTNGVPTGTGGHGSSANAGAAITVLLA